MERLTALLRRQVWRLLLLGIRNSGAAFIKWGQWSATREDLFPQVAPLWGCGIQGLGGYPRLLLNLHTPLLRKALHLSCIVVRWSSEPTPGSVATTWCVYTTSPLLSLANRVQLLSGL